MIAKNPRVNMYDIGYFSQFRIKHQKEFDDKLIQTSHKLEPLFKYIIETRRGYAKISKEQLDYSVDYDKIMSLIPKEEYKQSNKYKMLKFAS